MVTDYIEFGLCLDRYLNQGSTNSKHGKRLYWIWYMSDRYWIKDQLIVNIVTDYIEFDLQSVPYHIRSFIALNCDFLN